MSDSTMYITLTQSQIGVDVEQRTILDNMEVELVVGGGLSKVHHDDNFSGDGTATIPLKLSEEFVEKVDSKQDQLTAGTGIILEDNVISGDLATNTQAGIIKIATDEEAASSVENVAVNPKQLSTKITKNTDITPGTSTKITYDSKGLITEGTTLSAEDIPDLSATYVANTRVGVASGVAELGSDGKVPTSQLPSYVDDVIDSYIVSGSTALSAGWLSLTEGGTALTPETGKIYVVLTQGEYQNKTYRWSGSTYVEISSSPGQATETQAGIAEIATTAEVEAGVDDTRIVTPLKLHGEVSKYLPLTGGKITGLLGIESPTSSMLVYPALRDTSGVSWQLDIGSVLKSNNQWTANRWRFGNYAFTYEGDISYPCIGLFEKPFSFVYTKRLNSGEGLYNTLTVPNKQGTLATLDDIPHIQLSTMPTATADYLGQIVQFVGTTDSTYTNGYFYKCTSEEVTTANSVEFTPREGTTTVVTCDPDDFAAFITSTCADNPQWGSDGTDVTHGHIGIYSSTLYSFSMYSDEGVICAVSFPIVDLEAAGFTFTPPFGAQQGVDYTCTIGTTTTVYSWTQVDVQPDPDLSGYLPLTGGTISGDLNFLLAGQQDNRKVALRQNWITWGLNVQISDGTVYAIDQYGIWGGNGVKSLGLRGNRWRNVYTNAISSSDAGENLDITVPHISGKMGVQLSIIPVAAEEYLGHIYQYTGATDSTYTNGYFYKCISDGQDPATYSWVQTDVQLSPDPLPSQTGNAGKFLTTDGSSASWSDKPVVNNSTDSTGLAIGGGVSNALGYSVQIGYGSFAEYLGAYYAVGIGYQAKTGSLNSIAIGANAVTGVNVPYSIQLGSTGSRTVNNDANTFKVANQNGNFEIMSADGTIPADRLVKVATQYSTVPTADSTNLGKIIQYTGATDSTYTNGYFYKCVSDGQDPATYSWERIDVQPAGATYTAGNGISIDANNEISVTNPVLVNKATGTAYAGTPGIGICDAGSTLTVLNGVGIGNGVLVETTSPTQDLKARSVAIGNYARASQSGRGGDTAVGYNAWSNGGFSVAIGHAARTSASHAIQIGNVSGATTNSDANTFKVANENGNYEIMSSDGTIPTDRFTTTPVADGTYVPTLSISSGVATRSWTAPAGGSVPTLTWYTVSTPGSTLTIADTSSAQLVKVYKNGLLLEPTADYSISGTTLTMVTALVVGDKITTEVF